MGSLRDRLASLTPGPGAEVVWLLAARAFLLIATFLSACVNALLLGNRSAGDLSSLSFSVVVLLLVTAGSGLWLKAYGPDWRFTYAQLALDTLLVTVGVYVSGGAVSPFLFLYLPIAMAAAVLLSRRAAFIVGGLGFCSYLGLVALLVGGIIQPADGSATPELPTGGLFLQFTGLGSALILIAVATSFLLQKSRASAQLAAESQRDLAELSSRQRALLEELPAGVVTTSPDGVIRSLNRVASELFQRSVSEASGRRLLELLAELASPEEVARINAQPPARQRELELHDASGNLLRRVVFHEQPLHDDLGHVTGRYFLFQDVTKLRSLEEQVEMQERMARLLAEQSLQPTSGRGFSEFIGESPVMQKIFQLVQRVAHSDATVLITGESGTGKEVAARAIHFGGPRSAGPFVPVNCGAIPENLLESELFGHKKGAFTDAHSDYLGMFRQAEGGTIFLDEIGELPLHLQTKLLRVIQERAVHPIGGTRDIPINVRIVAATNRTLRDEIRAGKFREDLFYRLNVIGIRLPPLRDRRDDIPLLVNAVLKRLVSSGRTPVVSPAAMQVLMSHAYPGNVRELENILERALVLGGEVILPEHLPDSMRALPAAIEDAPQATTQIIVDDAISLPTQLDEVLASLERRYLEAALEKTQGAKKRAADLLGVNFRSFRYRLQKFGISADGE